MTRMELSPLVIFLLTVLIGLVGYIGGKMYDKIDELNKNIMNIMLKDIANEKDIDELKRTVEDHEDRLTGNGF